MMQRTGIRLLESPFVVHGRQLFLCKGLLFGSHNQQHFSNYGLLANTREQTQRRPRKK
jgi:hypothetical protein